MPVGATIGAAVVAGGATVASGAMASKAQKNAANTASSDELAVANQNNQLATNMYNANAARLDPYSALGLPAGAEYNGILGIAVPAGVSASAAPAPTPTLNSNGTVAGSGYTGPSMTEIMAMQHDGLPGNYKAALAAYNAAQSSGAMSPSSALAPFGASSGSALAPVVAQHAQQAIAAGADPQAVAAHAAQYGVSL